MDKKLRKCIDITYTIIESCKLNLAGAKNKVEKKLWSKSLDETEKLLHKLLTKKLNGEKL